MRSFITLTLFMSLASSKLLAGNLPKKISHDDWHTCILLQNGKMKCFGENSSGQLGTADKIGYGKVPDTMGSRLPYTNFGNDFVVKDMCASMDGTCAVNTNGQVKCWGQNSDGQAGTGKSDSSIMLSATSPFAELGAGFKAEQIFCGTHSICAISDKHQAKCWGANSYGQLGIGDTQSRGRAAAEVGENLPYFAAGATVKSMALASNHTCALFDDGVRCYGSGSGGVLGQGSSTNAGNTADTVGLKIPAIKLEADGIATTVHSISVGAQHSCVIYSVGETTGERKLKCWGTNQSGNSLGIGSAESHGATTNSMGANLPPVLLDDFSEIVQVEGHAEFSCARYRDGSVKCWGNNQQGQLGTENTVGRGAHPEDMGANLKDVDLGLPAKSISVGSAGRHSCAILVNNMVKCWGYGGQGNLGSEATASLGDATNSMGENLPFVRLD